MISTSKPGNCTFGASPFGGKADMALCGNPLLRSLLGVKRTWPIAVQMSAHDPKRTSSTPPGHSILPLRWLVLSLAAENRLRGFRQGLKETGYIEGESITIVYRWADDRTDQLPLLAAGLVGRSVAAIITAGVPSSLAAKTATTTIPIVFLVGNDPVQLGLVGSLSRPGGNLTGINVFTGALVAKRLEVLRDLLPQAKRIGVLVNPADAGTTDAQLKDLDAAARAMGLQIQVHNADTRAEIDAVFEGRRPGELWSQSCRSISSGRHVHRKDSQGRQAGRIAGIAADKIRTGYQPQDCEGAWPHRVSLAACPGRRGDRLGERMSAIGPKRTSVVAPHMSAFGGKADMTVCGDPLLRSLLGVKRTCPVAAHMSAFDPKRTSVAFRIPIQLGARYCPQPRRPGATTL
jgi:hypothetical protein